MTKGETTTSYTCDELYARLVRTTNAVKHAVFGEVRNGGGFRATRSADAISFALWPSDGYRITGYEIKASRSDWLRELKDPKKSHDMITHCDAWMIVANRGVVDRDKDEIPEAWGLMEPAADGLRVVRQYKPLRDLTARGPVSRDFLASLLRRAAETALTSEQAKIIRKEASAEAARMAKADLGYLREKFDKLKQQVDDFERESGVEINGGWNGAANVGKIVRDVLANKYSDPEHRLRTMLTVANGIADDISGRLKALNGNAGATE